MSGNFNPIVKNGFFYHLTNLMGCLVNLGCQSIWATPVLNEVNRDEMRDPQKRSLELEVLEVVNTHKANRRGEEAKESAFCTDYEQPLQKVKISASYGYDKDSNSFDRLIVPFWIEYEQEPENELKSIVAIQKMNKDDLEFFQGGDKEINTSILGEILGIESKTYAQILANDSDKFQLINSKKINFFTETGKNQL
jgi:hypothetical protein